MKTEVTQNNYRLLKVQIQAIKKQLEKELQRNHRSIRDLEKRQNEIKEEWLQLTTEMEKVGEFELESELKFLEEIERNCKRCGKVYDKRTSPNDLCPACFTSNS